MGLAVGQQVPNNQLGWLCCCMMLQNVLSVLKGAFVSKACKGELLLADWVSNYHLLLCMVTSAQVRQAAAVNG